MGLDHLLGRPSSTWKRIEVIAVSYAVLRWLKGQGKSTPHYFKPLNTVFKKFRPWQIVILTLLGRYLAGRIFLLTFLNAPEVYSKHYSRNFYRATWILTALDAGFWTAANIYPAPLRHVVSIVLSLWYLLKAEDADVKVRKIRSDCSVRMMRISWEKSTSPLLWLISAPFRPVIGFVDEFWISRDSPSDPSRFPTWRPYTRIKLYYAGSERQLASVQKLVLHFPGGGFITMSPENHEDYVRRWARSLGTDVAIASVDYGKAPEFPYPYAIEECFELYRKICETDGRILGLNANRSSDSTRPLKITIAGDSAGGNLTAAVTIKIIESLRRDTLVSSPKVPLKLQVTSQGPSTKPRLRKPVGLLIVYGALNFDMASWIAPDDSNAQLLRPESETSLSGLMKNYKGTKYHESRLRRLSGPSESVRVERFDGFGSPFLSLTSRVAFFNDRIIPPEMARAMSLLYLGSNSSVNPATDYYLSPLNAPEDILMEFPRIWMMCGECDPFVDDTVVFAARVRAAVRKKMEQDGSHEDDGAITDASDNDYSRESLQEKVSPTDSYPVPSLEAKSPDSDTTMPSWGGWASKLTRSFMTSIKTSPKDTDTFFSAEDQDDADSDSDDEYGEIIRDPSRHVTVKIYAGLSHAFLQMLAFLPEAHHAAALSGQWLCEAFELSERIAARKRRRRKRAQSRVRLEMRDEDNIPDAIDLPFGAEYRVGGRRLQLRSPEARSSPKKYRIGHDSDEEDDSKAIQVTDEKTDTDHPLFDAMAQKRYAVTNSHFPQPGNGSNRPLTSKSTVSTSTEKRVEIPSQMFLSESDLLSKRRDTVQREIYTGVDPQVAQHKIK
eukprot:Partr_v1_DN28413_c0_g1_i1_m41899 putative Lipase, hormone-sensitive